MKADPTAQAKLVTLAEVDAEIGRLTHRRSTLPELAQLDEAEQRVRAARDALVRAETRAGDLDRDERGVRGRIVLHDLRSAAAHQQEPKSSGSQQPRRLVECALHVVLLPFTTEF